MPKRFHPIAALAALFFAGNVLAHVGGEPKAAPTPPSTMSQVARSQTMAVVDALGRLNNGAPADRARLLGDLVSAAKARYQTLSTLVEGDPAEALRIALPAGLRAALPMEAAPFIEQEADETGELTVYHVDYTNPASDVTLYVLDTKKEQLSLNFADRAPDLLTGTRMHVGGIKVGTAIALTSTDFGVAKASALPNTLGVQKTLTILVNFSDAPTAQPFTVAYAQGVMFTNTGSTSNFDYEGSYQQTTLSGDVIGWFTIAETTTTCNYTNIASQAQQAATKAGYSLSNYTRLVYAFPSNTCGWWGLGTVGGNPSQAWVHAKYGFTLTVVGHEMGHNLGLYHSHSLDCGTAVVAASGCTTSEYGDVFDIMGAPSTTPHYSAFQKERLGWLNSGVSPPIVTVTPQSGTLTYTIAPMENARDSTPRALKIARGGSCSTTQEWFYVEARQAKGFDAFLSSNTNVQTGVLVHKVTGTDGNSSYLLDMTPATTSWSDPALTAGLTFTDPLTGLTITPVSVGSAGATINVTFGGGSSCTSAAPTVTATPTGTVWTTAGLGVGYAVSVTNNDSCGCAATSFNVSAVPPTGWSSTTAQTASVSPGATTSGNIVVTSPSGTPSNFYGVTVKGANANAPTMVGSVAETIAISSGLFASTATDASTYTYPARKNQTIYAKLTTIVNNGSSRVSGATVTMLVKNSGGSILNSFTGTTDGNGTYSATLGMKQRTYPAGSYTVQTTAKLGSLSASTSASFTVK